MCEVIQFRPNQPVKHQPFTKNLTTITHEEYEFLCRFADRISAKQLTRHTPDDIFTILMEINGA